MRSACVFVALASIVVTAQLPETTAMKMPADRAVVLSSAGIDRQLAAVAASPAGAVAHMVAGDAFSVNILRRLKPDQALIHAAATDVYIVRGGSGTLTTGGTLVSATATRGGASGAGIAGGSARHVSAGDIVVIPAGTPHAFSAIEGSITYLNILVMTPAGMPGGVRQFSGATIAASIRPPQAKPSRAGLAYQFVAGPPLTLGVFLRQNAWRPQVHASAAEIDIVRSGSGGIKTGGQLVDPGRDGETGDLLGNSISGGDRSAVAAGDVVLIPSGTPHYFDRIDSPITFIGLHVASAPNR